MVVCSVSGRLLDVSNTCSHAHSTLDVTGVPIDASMQVSDVGYIHIDDYKHVDA